MVQFLFATKIFRYWRLRCTNSKKKDLVSETVSNILCLQKKSQHDLRQQTDHDSESIFI